MRETERDDGRKSGAAVEEVVGHGLWDRVRGKQGTGLPSRGLFLGSSPLCWPVTTVAATEHLARN